MRIRMNTHYSGFVLGFVLILCNAYCEYALFYHAWSAFG